MNGLLAWARWKLAWWRWFYEPPAALDRKTRQFLPRGEERRKTLRLLRERHMEREPKLADFIKD